MKRLNIHTRYFIGSLMTRRKKLACLLAAVLTCALLQAQFTVKFIISEQTFFRHDSIFITGTFNNWDSTANPKYAVRPAEEEKSVSLNLPAGRIRYKYHRGSWTTVEKSASGAEVADRTVNITKDTVIRDHIENWRDELLVEMRHALQDADADTARIALFANIANTYAFNSDYHNADSASYYIQEAMLLLQKEKDADGYRGQPETESAIKLMKLRDIFASILQVSGNYPKSLELRFENLKLAEAGKNKIPLAITLNNISYDFISMKDYQNALLYARSMDSVMNIPEVRKANFIDLQYRSKAVLAEIFFHLMMLDSALYYSKQMVDLTPENGENSAFNSLLLAEIYAKKNNDVAAFNQYKLAFYNAYRINNPIIIANADAGLAGLFKKQGRLDSALRRAREAVGILQNNKSLVEVWGENSDTYLAEISPMLSELYQLKGQPDSAYKYLLLSVALKDSLYNADKVRLFQTLSFNETLRRQQLEQQSKTSREEYRTRLKMFGLVTGMAAFCIIAFIFYRNNRQKQKANAVLENTLDHLKSTQAQLIQSEKMASLGELTAGIAHEIQNPLNFVNNFSEINKELLSEIRKAIADRNYDELEGLLKDAEENEDKISHHGKRADAIVKGMLQHSRSSSAVKEPTDINKLADEYLRLAYHGLRAKDKSFNATLKTNYDETIGNINIIPQDIGRVILNLITNAFYAVTEKKESTVESYEPIVSISTKKIDNKVEIRVTDNGNGIPPKVLDKIFQPFFTTKPTGRGTGLGLSLSYDIVKVHGGELRAETKEGEYAKFIIYLPYSS